MRVPFKRLDQFTGGDVPQLHEFVGGTGNEILAVAAELDAHDGITVSIFELLGHCLRGDVPDEKFAAARRFAAAGGEPFSVAAERETQHTCGERRTGKFERCFLLRAKLPDQRPRGIRRPDRCRLIGRTADHETVRPGRECSDRSLVPGECFDRFAGRAVPNVYQIVVRRRQQPLAIDGERDALHRLQSSSVGIGRGFEVGIRLRDSGRHRILLSLRRGDLFNGGLRGLFGQRDRPHRRGDGVLSLFEFIHLLRDFGSGVGRGLRESRVVLLFVGRFLRGFRFRDGFFHFRVLFGHRLVGIGLGFVRLFDRFVSFLLIRLGRFECGFGQSFELLRDLLIFGAFHDGTVERDVSLEFRDLRAGLIVPELGDVVRTARRDEQAVRSNRDRIDRSTVSELPDLGTGGEIPNASRLVFAARQNLSATDDERDCIDRTSVPFDFLLRRERCRRRDRPDANDVVCLADDDFRSIGVEDHRFRRCGRFDFVGFCAVGEVPNSDRFIFRSRRQLRAVGTEGQAVNRGCVTGQHFAGRSIREVPQLDRVVGSSRRQRLTVGADRDRRHDCSNRDLARAIRHWTLPQLHRAKTTGSDRTTVRAKRQRMNEVTMRGSSRVHRLAVVLDRVQIWIDQPADFIAGLDIEQQHLIGSAGRDVATPRSHRHRVNCFGGRRYWLPIDLILHASHAARRAFEDPLLQRAEFLRRECLGIDLVRQRRHHRAFGSRGDLEQQALVRILRDDRRAALAPLHDRIDLLQIELALLLAEVVAGDAVILKDRHDVLVEIDRTTEVDRFGRDRPGERFGFLSEGGRCQQGQSQRQNGEARHGRSLEAG